LLAKKIREKTTLGTFTGRTRSIALKHRFSRSV